MNYTIEDSVESGNSGRSGRGSGRGNGRGESYGRGRGSGWSGRGNGRGESYGRGRGRGNYGRGRGGRGKGRGDGEELGSDGDQEEYREKHNSLIHSTHSLEQLITKAVRTQTLKHLDIPSSELWEQNWKIPHPKVEANPITHPLYNLLEQMYKEDCHKRDIDPSSHTTFDKHQDKTIDHHDSRVMSEDTEIIPTYNSLSLLPQPITIPTSLSGVFENPANYYLYQHTNKSKSFDLFEAIWCVVYPELTIWTENSIQNLIKEIRMVMSMELADTFKTNSYSVKGFKRSRMQKNLLTNDPLEPECLFYLADFLQVNIFIVKHKYYYCLNQIDDKTSDRVSIVIYYGVPDDSTTTTNTIDTYYSVLGEQKDSQYFKTSKLLEMFSDSDLTCISSESSQGITNNSGMLPKASQLKKMKVAELKEYALKVEIPIATEHGKSRLKSDILNDLLQLVSV